MSKLQEKTPSTCILYEECDQIWATSSKYSSLLVSQDQGEVPYTNTNIDLDQHESFDLNNDIHISLVHIIQTYPKVDCIDTTHFMVTVGCLRQWACNLSNVEGTLNSKRNDTPGKLLQISWLNL